MSEKGRTGRYHTSGKWFKGNTHIHSVASDGGMTPEQIGDLYASAGYDFLFATDHRVASDVTSIPMPPLLWIDGIELDGCDETGAYYHVVALGKVSGIGRETPFPEALRSSREQGALLVLAHPYWTGNSVEDALRWKFDGVEIYNHVCRWLNGKSEGGIHWNAMLTHHPGTLAFAVDDAHLRAEHPVWNGGWIMVNALDLRADLILDAVRAGNYYASCGPEFHSIETNEDRVKVTTSPVQIIRLVGPTSSGARIGDFGPVGLTEAEFQVPDNWPYAYIEIEDKTGKRAWTNTLFPAR